MATTTTESSVIDKTRERAAEAAATAVQKLREQADAVVERIQPRIAAVSTYARDEPTKALLYSAAAGAALMGLVALVVRSSNRQPASVRGSLMAAGSAAMAAIRDAALDLADSAQAMAADALDATKKRAASAFDSAQQRAAEALDSAQQRAADTLDATQKRAYAALDATKKRASDAAADAADSVTSAAADAWQKARSQAADRIRPQVDAAAQYVRDDPTRAVLGLAAAGALAIGLLALVRSAKDD